MAIFRAVSKCFIDHSLREVDEEFEYNGPPNKHLVRVGKAEVSPDSDATEEATTKKWKPKAKRSASSK
tara:strand:+ start:1416 stop:1619 length:204 start_codon:yes stop_codon:yes gene_type:complete